MFNKSNNINKLLGSSLLIFSLLTAVSALALEKPKEELGEAGIHTELGTEVDLGLPFTDENGNKRSLLSAVLPDKPLIVLPAYYQCPRLCGLLLTGFTKLLSNLDLELGKDYSVVTVSFNEKEGSKLALKRKQEYLAKLPKEKQEAAKKYWSFFVGSQESIHPLMKQIGFQFKPDKGEFAHAAAFMILTPRHQISQYFTGISFSPFDAKLALVEASQGGIGSALDHVLLYCFRFDPTKGKYTWAAVGLMQVGGVLTLLLLGGLVLTLLRKEKKRRELLSQK